MKCSHCLAVSALTTGYLNTYPKIQKSPHKTGELDSFKHDAGIVYGRTDYIIVVLTDTPNPQDAAEKTAELSKTVYEYFDARN